MLERLEAHDGSCCAWSEKFRIRHLATGRLLCLDSLHANSNASGSSEGGKVQVVSLTSTPLTSLGDAREDGSKEPDAATASEVSEIDGGFSTPAVAPAEDPPAEEASPEKASVELAPLGEPPERVGSAAKQGGKSLSSFTSLASGTASGAASGKAGGDSAAVTFDGSIGLRLAEVEERRGNEAVLGETVFTLQPLYSILDSAGRKRLPPPRHGTAHPPLPLLQVGKGLPPR